MVDESRDGTSMCHDENHMRRAKQMALALMVACMIRDIEVEGGAPEMRYCPWCGKEMNKEGIRGVPESEYVPASMRGDGDEGR